MFNDVIDTFYGLIPTNGRLGGAATFPLKSEGTILAPPSRPLVGISL